MLLRAPSHDRAPRPASSQIQKKAKPRGAQGGATCKVVADVGTIGSRAIKRQAHQSIECALWRRRCDQLHAVPRRFSRGFDGVPRDCAIHSEKQRSGANRSEAGGAVATGIQPSLASVRRVSPFASPAVPEARATRVLTGMRAPFDDGRALRRTWAACRRRRGTGPIWRLVGESPAVRRTPYQFAFGWRH